MIGGKRSSLHYTIFEEMQGHYFCNKIAVVRQIVYDPRLCV